LERLGFQWVFERSTNIPLVQLNMQIWKLNPVVLRNREASNQVLVRGFE